MMSNCGAFSNEFCIWKEVRITCSHGRLGVDGEDRSRLGEGQVVTFSPCQTCLSDDCPRKVAKFRRIRRDREWLLGQELAFLLGRARLFDCANWCSNLS
jgi:hypothetical protein